MTFFFFFNFRKRRETLNTNEKFTVETFHTNTQVMGYFRIIKINNKNTYYSRTLYFYQCQNNIRKSQSRSETLTRPNLRTTVLRLNQT